MDSLCYLSASAGLSALLFTGINGAATDLIFAETGLGWWGGNWWWVLATAPGGLTVAALRNGWQVDPEVSGASAFANQGWVGPKAVLYWTVVPFISIMTAASLGPSFALVVICTGCDGRRQGLFFILDAGLQQPNHTTTM